MIDRAKAKVAGATDYLTKPFSQTELENMVTKYLS
jgi:twitching motility two-component system response regulator PilG